MTGGASQPARRVYSRLRNFVNLWMVSVNETFRGTIEAGVKFEPITNGGRVTVLSLGVFGLMLLASFTAELTTSLVVETGVTAPTINSLKDAITQRR